MSKVQMIEEVIGRQPIELMLQYLWEDVSITDRLRNRLSALSEQNLIPYHNHFVGKSLLTERIQPKHIPLFKGGDTAKYVAKLHES